MGSDRQSILVHESGKKHREKMEINLQNRREEKIKEENEANHMEKTLKMMEAAANAASGGSFQQTSGGVGGGNLSLHGGDASSSAKGNELQDKSKGGMKSWQDRKEKRKAAIGIGSDAQDTSVQEESDKKRMKIAMELGLHEGHYQRGDRTILEGRVYAPIFEEDMPAQIWIGSETMTHEHKKSDDAQGMWKTGIILTVHKALHENTDQDIYSMAASITCDVSYLRNINDTDETIEKKVKGDRLQIQLGSDDLIPSTIEEARLSLMGGEEVITVDHGANAKIDENTGLSSWGTVSIRKVTVSQKVKDTRARARTKRREELEKEKMKEREAEARRMEEAKHSNADDSALGAYDVWAISGKGGYKGVQIHSESEVEGTDAAAQGLAQGNVDVQFRTMSTNKKSMFKRAKKKQNRRTTYADDD
eukprot:scaffold2355_cov267-Chaetoceros_neogracile.AAC.3